MKKILLISLLVFICSGITFILSYDHITGHFPWQVVQAEGLIYMQVHSRLLDEDRDIIVCLPTDYDSAASYPVMYVTDGSPADKHLADKFEVLSAAGYTPKVIVVSIPNMTGEGRQHNLTPPFMHTDALDDKSIMGSGDRF